MGWKNYGKAMGKPGGNGESVFWLPATPGNISEMVPRKRVVSDDPEDIPALEHQYKNKQMNRQARIKANIVH